MQVEVVYRQRAKQDMHAVDSTRQGSKEPFTDKQLLRGILLSDCKGALATWSVQQLPMLERSFTKPL